jgi:lysophospholipase L1-like esterase
MQYKASAIPTEPFHGTETWIDNVKSEIKRKKDKGEQFLKRISNILPLNLSNRNTTTTSTRRKIKLVLVGDSLVCGVGSKDLVLPKVMAKALSVALKADVSWRAEGINGGTSVDLRDLLPRIAGHINPVDGVKEEVFVVIICGLNDWKSVLLKFPFGSGPTVFKENLTTLLSDIKHMTGGNCKVFLPALPMVCAENDSGARYEYCSAIHY